MISPLPIGTLVTTRRPVTIRLAQNLNPADPAESGTLETYATALIIGNGCINGGAGRIWCCITCSTGTGWAPIDEFESLDSMTQQRLESKQSGHYSTGRHLTPSRII